MMLRPSSLLPSPRQSIPHHHYPNIITKDLPQKDTHALSLSPVRRRALSALLPNCPFGVTFRAAPDGGGNGAGNKC